MVRALQAGTKTQTRRVVKPHRADDAFVLVEQDRGWWPYRSPDGESMVMDDGCEYPFDCRYGVPGDRLRVKEAALMWCERRPNGTTATGRQKWLYVPMREAPVHYAADHPARPQVSVVSPDTGNVWGWRLKIGRFLPAWASRITLEVTGVRVERLQEVSIADCIAEGISSGGPENPDGIERPEYRALWESINGPGSWDANPFLWVVEFRRV